MRGMTHAQSRIFRLAQEQFSYVQKLRRQIHQHPETGFDVHETAKLVTQELQALGLQVKTGVGKTGVVADLEVPGATRRIALRADMDALPMDEENCLEYKSQVPGKAHMCGHDAHTAILLGAARLLSSISSELKSHVRFIFQPNEEDLPGGAPAMIEDGCLEGVNEIYGLHVWPQVNVKTYGLCRGPFMGRPDQFKITITGRGGHASLPHHAIDPIVVGSHLVLALQTIVSRNMDPDHTTVLSVTQFHAGTTHNIIPESAVIEGTFRGFDDSDCDRILSRIKELASGFEKAWSVRIQIDYTQGYPVLVNHNSAVDYVQSCLDQAFASGKAPYQTIPKLLGAEDFAYYLKHRPGCYVFLGCRNEEKGITRSCHDPRFNIDEDCLTFGVLLHAQLALQF
jgi:amidohydrolase